MSEEILDNPDTGTSEQSIEQPGSIIDTAPAESAAPQTWPDTWRQELAGEDEKALKQLERLNSPKDLGKSWLEAQKKISSYKPAVEKPGAEATPEQVKAYRESLGVPDDPSGYNLDFEDGTVIGEDIKPQLDGFLKYAHDKHLPPGQVKDTLSWYMKDVQEQQESLKLANDEARIEGTAELRSEWGGEFQGNMNAVHTLFNNAPEGTMEKLLNSTGPDGLKFANSADNIRWLVGLAKDLNPQATLVPPGPDQAASIDKEIEDLQKLMHSKDPTEKAKYWKDESKQKRYAALMQSKSAR